MARPKIHKWNNVQDKLPNNRRIVACVASTFDVFYCRYMEYFEGTNCHKFLRDDLMEETYVYNIISWRNATKEEQYECWLKRVEARKKNETTRST